MKRSAQEILNDITSEFFTAVFIKRTTGERRQMTCRKGVKKHLRGGKAAYNFADKGLLSVYDVQKKGYRCIPVDNVLEIRSNGKIYKIS